MFGRDTPTSARAGWDELLLVCKKCLRRQGRDARVDGEDFEDWLKRETRALGKDRLRMSKCACLDLCPKRGVVLARGSELASGKPLRVVRNGDDPETLRRWLRGDSGGS